MTLSVSRSDRMSNLSVLLCFVVLQQKNVGQSSAGLFTYPVLQAADVLLYKYASYLFYAVFHKKEPLSLFCIILLDDDQFTQNFYQL